MNRLQKQAALLGGLVVVMVLVYARAFRASGPATTLDSSASEVASRPSGSSEPSAETTGAAVPLEPTQAPQRDAQRAREEELAWRRDPFTHGPLAGQLDGLTLSGILWDASAPIAIISGQMLRVGEEFEGYRIVEIQQDRVILTDGANTVQLLIAP